jgi:arylsulfatase A-like enzyme
MKHILPHIVFHFMAFMVMTKGTGLAKFLFVPPESAIVMLGLLVVYWFILYIIISISRRKNFISPATYMYVAFWGTVVAYFFHQINYIVYMNMRDLPVDIHIFGDEFKRAVFVNFPILVMAESARRQTYVEFGELAANTFLCLFAAYLAWEWAYHLEPREKYPPVAKASVNSPNVIVILADDLGVGDLSLNGNSYIQTPNIDSLAKGGVNFSTGYCSSPICSPSRAGLMTGQYQQRMGFEHLTDAISQHLMSRKTDFADAGNELGDESWMKYEVARRGIDSASVTLAEFLKTQGYATGVMGKWHLGIIPKFHPYKHGFDYHFGTYNAGMYYGSRKDTSLVESIHPDNFVDLLEWQIMNYRLFENGSIVRNQKEDYTTDLFTNKSIEFIEKNKENRFFLYLPFTAVHSPLQAPKRLYDQLKHIKDHHKRVYAAMVMSLDEAVGKVMQKLKASGLDENTIVFFASDNGAPLYYPAGENTPYYGGKMSNFEGGLRVPFVMRWKNHLTPQTYRKPVSLMDVFPTVAGALKKPLSKDVAQDGINLMPFLETKTDKNPHETLFWRTGYAKAIRKGNWKLHVNEKEGFIVLHDLSKDSLETNNVAAKYPFKVAELRQLLAHWEVQMKPSNWKPSADVKIDDGKGHKYWFPW